jgi:adenylate kinase family enzyme
VYGVTGSGKSTLASQLGARLGLPYHPVDDLTWEPGWIPVPDDVQRDRIAAICAQDRWVLDSAYGIWRDIPLATADLVVGLDFPRWLSLTRLVRRTVTRSMHGTTVCNGNRESIRLALWKDSIIGWHFRSFRRKRQRMRQWQNEPGRPPVILFGRPGEVARWLAVLPASEEGTPD